MKKRWIVEIIRYLPIIVSIHVIIVGLSILCNFYNPLYCTLFTGLFSIGGVITEWLLSILSKELKFCVIHRLIIYNLMFISFLYYLESNKIEINYGIYFMIIPTTTLLVAYAIKSFNNGLHKKKEVS